MVSRELNKRVCPTVAPRWHPLKYINLSRPLHCHPSTMVSLFYLPLWSLTIWFKCLLLPCPIIKDTELSVFFSLICILWPSCAGNVRLGVRAVFQAWFRLLAPELHFSSMLPWGEENSFKRSPSQDSQWESGNVSSNLVFDHFFRGFYCYSVPIGSKIFIRDWWDSCVGHSTCLERGNLSFLLIRI